MARIDTGDTLATALLQPGAKTNNDGYGLLTATVQYKEDVNGSTAFLARGSALSFNNSLKLHKATTTRDALGLVTYTCDYAGIAVGTKTDCEVRASQGLTTEHITTHPNFFTAAAGFTGGVIAGVGTGTPTTPVYAANANGTFDGANGSTFQLSTGGKFLGFQKPLFETLYGKTSYLAPITSFAGHFYTSAAGNVTGLLARVGKTSNTNTFNGLVLLPAYMGTLFVTTAGYSQLLLSQVNVEDFADLFKVNYEIRYNREGYDSKVYAPN